MARPSPMPLVSLADGISGRLQPGGGDSVIWLHGYTLDSSSWAEIWSLLPGWNHIGPDLPCHGASEPVSGWKGLRDLANRLGRLCIERDVRHLAALSFGTITAIQMLIQFPEVFASAVLAAPAIAGGPSDPGMAHAYSKLFGLYRRHASSGELQRTWMDSPAWKGIEKRPGLGEDLRALVARHSWAELGSLAWMLQFTSPTQKESNLMQIRTPILVLVGEHEMEAFRQNAQLLLNTVPGCRRHELADADHLCVLQTPERSARLIDEHIRAHARKAPARLHPAKSFGADAG
ncbi:MAG: alpha/beta hydrolase [Desulfobacteraceae bacterium]|nr:alpha/beta hydrolase [Desulfobacteraceae bacterium]